MKNFLLDSVIIIDHLNNISQATDFINSNYEVSLLSVITRAEVLVGASNKNHLAIKRLLDSFETILLISEIADIAATLRCENKWRLPDAFQAAVCKYHDLTLVTRNSKNFSSQKHSFVHIPYQLT